MMRNLHKYEELLPQEFEAEMERCPIIYCAFGPMELHGLQNALGIDPVKAYEVCLRAAAISGGIVHPMVPIAPQQALPSWEFMNREKPSWRSTFPNVMISADLCAHLYRELFECFAVDLGFKVCVPFGGHGPAGTLIKNICEDCGGEIKGMKLLPTSSLSHNLDVVKEELERLGVERVSHGGIWETAMNMACKRDYVDTTVFDRPHSPRFACYSEVFSPMPAPNEEQRKTWAQDDWDAYYATLSPSIAEIRKTTPEFGERLLQVAAERIAAEAVALLET